MGDEWMYPGILADPSLAYAQATPTGVTGRAIPGISGTSMSPLQQWSARRGVEALIGRLQQYIELPQEGLLTRKAPLADPVDIFGGLGEDLKRAMAAGYELSQEGKTLFDLYNSIAPEIGRDPIIPIPPTSGPPGSRADVLRPMPSHIPAGSAPGSMITYLPDPGYDTGLTPYEQPDPGYDTGFTPYEQPDPGYGGRRDGPGMSFPLRWWDPETGEYQTEGSASIPEMAGSASIPGEISKVSPSFSEMWDRAQANPVGIPRTLGQTGLANGWQMPAPERMLAYRNYREGLDATPVEAPRFGAIGRAMQQGPPGLPEMVMPQAIRPEGYTPGPQPGAGWQFAKMAVPNLVGAIGGPVAAAAAGVGMNLLLSKMFEPEPPPKPPSLYSEYLPLADHMRQETADSARSVTEQMVGAAGAQSPATLARVAGESGRAYGGTLAQIDAQRAEQLQNLQRLDAEREYQWSNAVTGWQNQLRGQRANTIAGGFDQALAGIYGNLEERDAIKRGNQQNSMYMQVLSQLLGNMG